MTNNKKSRYLIRFDSYKEGTPFLDREMEVVAYGIYDAMGQVEDYCHSNYASCEITYVEKLDEQEY